MPSAHNTNYTCESSADLAPPALPRAPCPADRGAAFVVIADRMGGAGIAPGTVRAAQGGMYQCDVGFVVDFPRDVTDMAYWMGLLM